MNFKRAPFIAALFLCVPALADESAGPAYVAYQASGIYALGETAGWNVTLPWNSPTVSYVIRKNNLAEIGRGTLPVGEVGLRLVLSVCQLLRHRLLGTCLHRCFFLVPAGGAGGSPVRKLRSLFFWGGHRSLFQR